MSRIGESLKVLSIFHYIVGALYGLYFCLIGLTTALMVGFGLFSDTNGKPIDPEVKQTVMLVSGGIGLVLLMMGLAFALLTIWSGRCIAKRKRRYFSLVMASVNLLAFPFGTVLGIFAFILLRREDAVHWYAGAAAQPPVNSQ